MSQVVFAIGINFQASLLLPIVIFFHMKMGIEGEPNALLLSEISFFSNKKCYQRWGR